MAKQKSAPAEGLEYLVLSGLELDGENYGRGDTVTLEPDRAYALIESGVLTPKAPPQEAALT